MAASAFAEFRVLLPGLFAIKVRTYSYIHVREECKDIIRSLPTCVCITVGGEDSRMGRSREMGRGLNIEAEAVSESG